MKVRISEAELLRLDALDRALGKVCVVITRLEARPSVVKPGGGFTIEFSVSNECFWPHSYDACVYFGRDCASARLIKCVSGWVWRAEAHKIEYTAPSEPGDYLICARTNWERDAGRDWHTVALTVQAPPPPGMGTLIVHTKPTGALVSVYNRERRECVSPCTLTLPPGVYTVVARKKGYKTASTTAEVEKGKTTTVTLELQEKVMPAWVPSLVAGVAGLGVGVAAAYVKRRRRR